MQKTSKVIVFTGGHAGSTAYAVISELLRNHDYEFQIHFIGANSALEGTKVQTFESQFLPKLGVIYHGVSTGRLQRKFTFRTIPSILRIPFGFFQTFGMLKRIKPDLVFSFGGFASFPVVFWAKLFSIPVILHEQTAAIGRANKLAIRFADKILLARSESLPYFNSQKTIVTGNPVSPDVANVGFKTKVGNPPVIFITEGSRGSRKINENFIDILPKLLTKFKVIHQVGSLGKVRFERIKAGFGELGKSYTVYGVIDPKDWAKILSKSDIIVSRAGANIVSEIIVIKRPAVLIPIPWSYEDEQTKNAKIASSDG